MQNITNTQIRLKIPHGVTHGAGSLRRRVNLQAFFYRLEPGSYVMVMSKEQNLKERG